MALKYYYHGGTTIKPAELFLTRHILETYNGEGFEGDCILYSGALFAGLNPDETPINVEADTILFTPHAMILIEMKSFQGPYRISEEGSNAPKVFVMKDKKWVEEFYNDLGEKINSFHHGCFQLKRDVITIHKEILGHFPEFKNMRYAKSTVRGILLMGQKNNPAPVFQDLRTAQRNTCNYDAVQQAGTYGLIYPVSNGATSILDFEEKEIGKFTFWDRVKEIEEDVKRKEEKYKASKNKDVFQRPDSDAILQFLLYEERKRGVSQQFTLTIPNDGYKNAAPEELKQFSEFEKEIKAKDKATSASPQILNLIQTSRQLRDDIKSNDYAIDLLKDGLKLASNDGDRNRLYAELGFCEYRVGHKETAFLFFEKLRGSSAYVDAETCFDCGKIYYREGKREWALDFMKKAEKQGHFWGRFYALAYERYPIYSDDLLLKYKNALDAIDPRNQQNVVASMHDPELRFWIQLNCSFLHWAKGLYEEATRFALDAREYQNHEKADKNCIITMIIGLYYYHIKHDYGRAKEWLLKYYRNIQYYNSWYPEPVCALADCCLRSAEAEEESSHDYVWNRLSTTDSGSSRKDPRKTEESNLESQRREKKQKYLERAKEQYEYALTYSGYVKGKTTSNSWKAKAQEQYQQASEGLSSVNARLKEIKEQKEKEAKDFARREWLIGEWYHLAVLGLLALSLFVVFSHSIWMFLLALALPFAVFACKCAPKLLKGRTPSYDLPSFVQPMIGNETSSTKYNAIGIMAVTSFALFFAGAYACGYVPYDIALNTTLAFSIHSIFWIGGLALLVRFLGGPVNRKEVWLHSALVCAKHFALAACFVTLAEGASWACRSIADAVSYWGLQHSERVEKALAFYSVDSVRTVSNWDCRAHLRTTCKRNPVRIYALTERNGVLGIYGSNGYITSGVPEKMAETLQGINTRRQEIIDVALTESGRWIVAYDTKTVEGEKVPQAMLDYIRNRIAEDDIIRAVTFNDKGDWIVVTENRFNTSNPRLQDWIKHGIDKYGQVQKAYIYDDCAIVRFENGIETAGRIPQTLIEALLKDGEWAYDIRCVGQHWAYASKDGKRYNYYF